MFKVYSHETVPSVKIMNIFITPKSYLIAPWESFLLLLRVTLPVGNLLGTTGSQLSVAIDSFAFFRIVYKWNNTLCILFFCLASFTQRNCCKLINVIILIRVHSFYCQIVFHYVNILQFISSDSPIDEHLVVYSSWLQQIKLL